MFYRERDLVDEFTELIVLIEMESTNVLQGERSVYIWNLMTELGFVYIIAEYKAKFVFI